MDNCSLNILKKLVFKRILNHHIVSYVIMNLVDCEHPNGRSSNLTFTIFTKFGLCKFFLAKLFYFLICNYYAYNPVRYEITTEFINYILH